MDELDTVIGVAQIGKDSMLRAHVGTILCPLFPSKSPTRPGYDHPYPDTEVITSPARSYQSSNTNQP